MDNRVRHAPMPHRLREWGKRYVEQTDTGGPVQSKRQSSPHAPRGAGWSSPKPCLLTRSTQRLFAGTGPGPTSVRKTRFRQNRPAERDGRRHLQKSGSGRTCMLSLIGVTTCAMSLTTTTTHSPFANKALAVVSAHPVVQRQAQIHAAPPHTPSTIFLVRPVPPAQHGVRSSLSEIRTPNGSPRVMRPSMMLATSSFSSLSSPTCFCLPSSIR